MLPNYSNRWMHSLIGLMLGLVFSNNCLNANMPHPWQVNFQPAATPVMERIASFHNILLVIIFVIGGLVGLLLLYVVLRYNSKANPNPQRFTHNVALEILWTAVPALIVVAIMVPSLKLIYFAERAPGEPELTIKAIGKQWYWTYEYPEKNISFDSYMILDKDLKPGDLRLLSVDNPVVIPVNTNVRILTTASDVIHSWAVPAFGVKRDAVPGRVNELWVKALRTGTYYGQCSELCGMNHGFMPIEVRVVSPEEYQSWLQHQQATAGNS